MKAIEVNGITVRYLVEGSGPWVTLSHSLTTDLSMWDGLAAALKDSYTVLRYDTRGHGGGSAPGGAYSFEQLVADVTGLLDALKVERTHFVGLSMGGMIGQHLALLAPQRVDKLVIASSTSRIPPEAAAMWDQRIAQARAEGTGAMAEATLGRWFTPSFRAAHPEIMTRIAALIAATPAAGYVGCGEAIRRLDITGRLPSIRTPTLVVVGADDPGTPPAASEVIAEGDPWRAAGGHCLRLASFLHRAAGDFQPAGHEFSQR
jgi:3-oxoadipate enol-lactonase